MDSPRDLVRIGEGVQAEVFLRPDGTVLKLWRRPDGRPAVEREAAALRALRGPHGIAPALVDVVEVAGRPGLVMERVEGDGLAGALRSRPWAVGVTARALAQCQVDIHAIQAPDSLPALSVELRRRIGSSDAVPTELADLAVGVLERLPDGDRLCHGDFHIANVLGTLNRPTVIDWPNASRGDPDADVAHTNILHRFGRPREGTTRLEKTVVNIGRNVFASRYLSAYRSLRALDSDRLYAWETVRAAARLSTEVPRERSGLIHFLEQRLADHRA